MIKQGLITIFFISLFFALVVGGVIAIDSCVEYVRNNRDITQYQLSDIMRRATAFESDGNLSLREAVKAKLAKSPTLTYGDFKQLDEFADKIEMKAQVEIFNKDLYKYRSRGGLTVDLPEGYIEKKETK